MKQLIILLAATSLFIVSCNNSGEKDLSYSADAYVKMGMPDYKTAWTQEDYMNAFTALNRLRLTKPSSLPMKNSAKSGAYFDRMLSEENFSFLQEESLSLSEKAFQIQYYASLPNALIGIYSNGLNKDAYYHQELVEFYIFGLWVSQKKLDLANRIMKSEDPNVKNLQRGLVSVQRGYMEMALYVLENQNNSTVFTEKDLERLSNYVSKSLTLNKVWMKSTDAEYVIK
ncbi:MAG: hypothetical protein KAR17_01820, partial [Cyclobacteriaceae bacterium]|nr:hypothetical protein [Cyclobacteriaceae bacterium]